MNYTRKLRNDRYIQIEDLIELDITEQEKVEHGYRQGACDVIEED